MVSHLYLKEAENASSVILIAILVCVAVSLVDGFLLLHGSIAS